MTFTKTLLAVLVSATLVGCGGGGDSAPEVKPPVTTPDTSVPTTPLDPSKPVIKPPVNPSIPGTEIGPSNPLPTTPCGENGACLEDDFLTDNLPMIPVDPFPPTADCGENGACLEDDFLVELKTGKDISVFAELLGYDAQYVAEMCNETFFSCGYYNNQPYIEKTGIALFPLTGDVVVSSIRRIQFDMGQLTEASSEVVYAAIDSRYELNLPDVPFKVDSLTSLGGDTYGQWINYTAYGKIPTEFLTGNYDAIEIKLELPYKTDLGISLTEKVNESFDTYIMSDENEAKLFDILNTHSVDWNH